MKTAYLIIIGALLLICAWLYFSNSGQISPQIDSAKYDSLLRPHLRKLAQLQRAVIITKHTIQVTKEKAKSDSITYKKTISRLQKELAVTKYKGNISTISQDSIHLALDVLARSGIADSMYFASKNRIERLEAEKVDLVKDYESIMDTNQEEKNELYSMISIKDDEIKELKGQVKKAGRRGFVKGLLVGMPIGSATTLAIEH